MTIEEIRDRGLILFEAIRGSKCHGTDTPTSDTDTIGIYIAPQETLLGLGYDYQSQITNETNDNVFYELGKFMKLLVNSNPTVLETLFIDDEFVLYEHPIFTELKKHRDMFVTKRCFNSYFGYSFQQIKKCKGYNKLCVNPVTTEAYPLDFCYTFYKQGSTKLIDWLRNHGFYQKYCGLVKVPNMHDVYGVYYDWKAHWRDLEEGLFEFQQLFNEFNSDLGLTNFNDLVLYLNSLEVLGYSGIVAEDGSSKTLRYIQDNYVEKDGIMLNSVAKDAKPICYMSYNADGFAKHQRDYTRYQKWLKERNEERFNLNDGYNFDAKNVSEAFRLMNMAIEIAKGEGVKVNRKFIDREFLLDVKNHKYTYEEIIPMLEAREQLMHEVVEYSTLPEDIDEDKVNELLIKIRKEWNTKT